MFALGSENTCSLATKARAGSVCSCHSTRREAKKGKIEKKKKIVGGVKYGLEFVDDGLVKICLGLVSVSYLMRVLERTIGGPFCRLVDDVQ